MDEETREEVGTYIRERAEVFRSQLLRTILFALADAIEQKPGAGQAFLDLDDKLADEKK